MFAQIAIWIIVKILRKEVEMKGMKAADVEAIMKKVEEGHYQVQNSWLIDLLHIFLQCMFTNIVDYYIDHKKKRNI